MADRLARIISDQVLLGNIGHVIALIVLSQEMIVRLLFGRSILSRDRLVPFFRVLEFRVYIEDNAPKRVFLVSDNLAQMIFGV